MSVLKVILLESHQRLAYFHPTFGNKHVKRIFLIHFYALILLFSPGMSRLIVIEPHAIQYHPGRQLLSKSVHILYLVPLVL